MKKHDSMVARIARIACPAWQGLAALRWVFACLMPVLLVPGTAHANSVAPGCAEGPGGEYLRADGHGDKPWSLKVPGQRIVYVERCFMDALLAFFPGEVRERRVGGGSVTGIARRPAPYETPDGRRIVTLSPESRFQVAAAILYVESHFHPNVSPSSAGAIGAFQVLPTTGDQLGLTRLREPGVNLKAGLRYILYIEEQIDRYCGFTDSGKERSRRYRELIAASYNAGPGYLQKRDARGRACRLDAFPKFSREEYVARFRRALSYRFLPGYLRYDPSQKIARQ